MFYNPIEGQKLGKDTYKAIDPKNPQLGKINDNTSYEEARKILGANKKTKQTHHIFVGSNKGGVGKSMTALQLAWFLNARGYNVLLADLDAQGNITCPLLMNQNETEAKRSFYDVLLGDCGFDEVVFPIVEGLNLMGANHKLSLVDSFLRNMEKSSSDPSESYFNRDKRESSSEAEIYKQMYDVFKKLGEAYDFVIYDTNPETNKFNRISMQVCDIGIVPIQAKESSSKAYMVTLSEINDSFLSIGRDTSNIEERIKLLFNNKENIPESRKEELIEKLYKYYNGKILDNYIDFCYEMGEASDVGFPAFGNKSISLDIIKNFSSVVDEIISMCNEISIENLSSNKKKHLFFQQA